VGGSERLEPKVGVASTAGTGATPMNEWTRHGYTITTDQARFDLDVIYRFLSGDSYWARGMRREVFDRSICNSLCFGLLSGDRQVGFARVISDMATIAYLGDVFIAPEHRGKGLSKWLMECVMTHPSLQGLRRWILVTADAHGVYERVGFGPLKAPERYMEKHDPEVYRRS
jgi:GNAT superfamily N-acetyltransferase